MIPIPFLAIFLLLPSLLFGAENAAEQSQEVEKRMLSYADLMNNFGGPSSLDFFGAPSNSPLFMLDEERPKREEGDDEMQLSLWKRTPLARGFMNGAQRNYLMKKDEFVAPGVLRFGKRMPGVLRFGKRVPIHEKKAVPGVLRFGKREAPEGAVPGVLRFGKRMPQVLRFG